MWSLTAMSWTFASTSDRGMDETVMDDTDPGEIEPHWLTKDDVVLASLEMADGRSSRAKGLLGRDMLDGELILPHTRSVHSFGMRFTFDVAICDPDLRVRRTLTLRPARMTRPEMRATTVIEAPSGALELWGVRPGDQLAIR